MEQHVEVHTVTGDEKAVKIQSNTGSTTVGASTTFEEKWGNKYLKFGIAPAQVERALPIAQGLGLEEARQILTEYLEEYSDDLLVPASVIAHVRELLNIESTGSEKTNLDQEETIVMTAAVLSSDSAYREVRSAFTPDDDPSIPAGTVRAWVIGLVWAVGIAAINQFFHPRAPAITVGVSLAQLLALPMGKLAEKLLPNRIWLKGTRFEFNLNPGPWSLKEQTLITIMSNVTSGVPYVMDVIFIQKLPLFLGQEFAGDFGYQICMILSTQLLGFSLAGFSRRFLVYPPSMIWWQTLSQGVLNETLISSSNYPVHGWKITRFKFFGVAFACMFLYFWLPNTIFPTLTFFNWITWIHPTSAVISIITGSYYFNLGLNPLSSFDWNWFAVLDPILIPLPIAGQLVGSMLLWAVCVIIPVFFTNAFWTGYLPINSWLAYDNQGHPYQAARILTKDLRLDEAKYKAYSPVFLSAASTARFAGMFMMLITALTFSVLWYGKSIVKTVKLAVKGEGAYAGRNDAHSRAMKHYRECPDWVFLAVGVVAILLGLVGMHAWPTRASGWTIPISFLISMIFVIPVGLIAAVSNYVTTLEILFAVIGGYLCAGNPNGLLVFKMYGIVICTQAVYYSQDMKLGHYAKIPPRQMIAAQVVAVTLAAFATLGVSSFQLNGIHGICNPKEQVRWVCPMANSLFAGTLQWGLIGTRRLFGPGGLYEKLPYAFIAGLLWPVPWYFARKKWPNSWVRSIHPVILLLGSILWAPLNFSMFWQALPLSVFFGWYLKTRYLAWWSKYALVLSSAFTAGIAISALIQFFAVTYPNITFPAWWGTTQYENTCDFQDCRWLKLAKGEKFGPKSW